MLRTFIVVIGLLPVGILWLAALIFGYYNFYVMVGVVSGAVGLYGVIQYLKAGYIEDRKKAARTYALIIIGLLAVVLGSIFLILDPAPRTPTVLLVILGIGYITGLGILIDMSFQIKAGSKLKKVE